MSPPYFTVPFQLDGDAIKVEIRINGKPVEAELDSGAGLTYITRLDAQRAGVTAEMMAANPTETLHGVDESAVAGRRHRFASLEFGTGRLKNVPLTVAPSAVGVSLLGDEFFPPEPDLDLLSTPDAVHPAGVRQPARPRDGRAHALTSVGLAGEDRST